MHTGIYPFDTNNFIQFKNDRGGIFLDRSLGILSNPVLCSARIDIYTSPRIGQYNRGKTTVQVGGKKSDVSYTLSRDMRQPRVCPSCTPLSTKIENGIVLDGVGGWLFTKGTTPQTTYTIDLSHENDFWYVARGGNLDLALNATFEYITDRINITQKTLQEIQAISRAPVIEKPSIEKMLDFVKKTSPKLFK